ncbi:MAG TPA: ferritin-like domain-containing protein [Longimicrobiales bacterium]
MAESSSPTESSLIAELNDLLQLDHDAVQAYTMAIENLETEHLRSTLMQFRSDHERHITNLTDLIRSREGMPLDLAHIPTGLFKLAVQKVGTAGGDREILLAFKANERQVRDKYRRSAEAGHPTEVTQVIERNASDEERHYDWVVGVLEGMGAGEDTMVGRAEGVFERVHEATADAIEGAERKVMEGAESARRGAMEMADRARVGAGAGLDRTADALDRAGDWAERKDGAAGIRAGRIAHNVADSLERAADYVRERDLRAMRADVERQVDAHPIRMALIALGTGLVVGRLLR